MTEQEETNDPIKYWEEVLRTNKQNLSYEKDNIKKYTESIEMIKSDHDNRLKGLDMDKQETELLMKLYPEHGDGRRLAG